MTAFIVFQPIKNFEHNWNRCRMTAGLSSLSEICKKFHTAHDMFTVSNFKLGVHMLVENAAFPIHFIVRLPVVQLQQSLAKSPNLILAQV